MKATFIYPGVGILGFGQVNIDGSGESKWINHGVALIGAYAKSKGHEVDLIDMRTLNSWDEFRAEIINRSPDVIGIGCSYLDWKPAQEAFRIIKEVNPSIKTISGGLFPSIFPKEAVKNMNIDYIIKGEGEYTFSEILEEIEQGKQGDRFREGEIIENLDDLPFAARDLFDYSRELSIGICPGQPAPTITMIAGRGCPYVCLYCQPAERAVFKGKFRMRSPQNVIDELIQLRSTYPFNSITWWDDTFTTSAKWVYEFCDLYQANGFTQEMVACSRADIICKNEAMIERLAEVGMKWFIIGLETGTNRMLDFIKKGTTVEQNLEAARICRKYGIKIFATWMLGLPTETPDDSRATVAMINQIQPEHSSMFYFNPIPGTHIYDFCEVNDLILRDDPFDIERTGQYEPKIKGINYELIGQISRGEA